MSQKKSVRDFIADNLIQDETTDHYERNEDGSFTRSNRFVYNAREMVRSGSIFTIICNVLSWILVAALTQGGAPVTPSSTKHSGVNQPGVKPKP